MTHKAEHTLRLCTMVSSRNTALNTSFMNMLATDCPLRTETSGRLHSESEWKGRKRVR